MRDTEEEEKAEIDGPIDGGLLLLLVLKVLSPSADCLLAGCFCPPNMHI